MVGEFKKKFVLGVAQFGKPYGINNLKKKKIKKNEVNKIFEVLLKNNISHLDSAESYKFNLKILHNKNFKIDTKIIFGKKIKTKKNLINILKKYKKKNLFLDTVYIHNPEKIFTKQGNRIYNLLVYLKKEKFFRKLGISVYDLFLLKKILKKIKPDVVQLPYNVLDRRFEKYFKILKKKKILIYCRSIFLQGALVSKNDNKVISSKEVQNFKTFCNSNKLQELSACINFVIKNKLISKYIIGVDDSAQLKQILSFKKKNNIIFSKKLLTNNLNIIDPRNWKDYLFK